MLPAYKFARSQGPDTHVMCYRVFAGEPSSNPLGSGQQTAHVSLALFLNEVLFRTEPDLITNGIISHHVTCRPRGGSRRNTLVATITWFLKKPLSLEIKPVTLGLFSRHANPRPKPSQLRRRHCYTTTFASFEPTRGGKPRAWCMTLEPFERGEWVTESCSLRAFLRKPPCGTCKMEAGRY